MKISHSFLLIFFFTTVAKAQLSTYRSTVIDNHAKDAPADVASNAGILSMYLARPAINDEEKVRSIYTWINENISYDMLQYIELKKTGYKSLPKSLRGFKNYIAYHKMHFLLSTKWRSLNYYKQADVVLKRKQAICQGYASLFKSLCNMQNIPCEIIGGYAKGYGYDVGDKFYESNHEWVAVFVAGKWQLLDPTWKTYISDPAEFAFTHLPADPLWQLLPETMSMEIFESDSTQIAAFLQGNFDYKAQQNVKTLENYCRLSNLGKELKTAENALNFNNRNHSDIAFGYLNYARLLLKDSLPGLASKDAQVVIAQQSVNYLGKAKNHLKQVETASITAINKQNEAKNKKAHEERQQKLDQLIKEIKSTSRSGIKQSKENVKGRKSGNKDQIAAAKASYDKQIDSIDQAGKVHLESLKRYQSSNYDVASAEHKSQVASLKAQSRANVAYLKASSGSNVEELKSLEEKNQAQLKKAEEKENSKVGKS